MAERLLTDNAWAYTNNRALKQLLPRPRDRAQAPTRPYRPQTNGKVERYQQTLAREWAYGQTYTDSQARHAALAHWLEHYNTRRPHSAIGDRPPLAHVHHLIGHNT